MVTRAHPLHGSHALGEATHNAAAILSVAADLMPRTWLPSQAAHIYAWVKARTGFEPSFRVVFYPAEYFRRMLGIFPIGDPTQYIPDDEARCVA